MWIKMILIQVDSTELSDLSKRLRLTRLGSCLFSVTTIFSFRPQHEMSLDSLRVLGTKSLTESFWLMLLAERPDRLGL